MIQTPLCRPLHSSTSANPLAYANFPSDLSSFDPALIAGLYNPSTFPDSLNTSAGADSSFRTHSQHVASGQVSSQAGVPVASQGARTAGQPHMQEGALGSESSTQEVKTEAFVKLLLLVAGQGAYLFTRTNRLGG